MENEEFIKTIKSSARGHFTNDGCHHPIAIVVAPEGMGVVPLAHLEKDQAAFLITRLRAQFKQVVYICEEWVATATHRDDIKGQVKDHPGREEAIMLFFYLGLKTTVIRAMIHRSGYDNVELKDWEAMPEGEMSGRFVQSPAEWN